MMHNLAIIGLSLLNDKPIPARGDVKVYPLGTILGDYLCVGDKPGGVEPGFLGIKMDDALIYYFQENYSEAVPANQIEFKNYIQTQLNPNNTEVIGKFNAFIQSLNANCRAGRINTLKLWLFKQDYNDRDDGLVAPPLERLAKTEAVKAYNGLVQPVVAKAYEYGRLNTRENENVNAILECLATEIARLYGMQVQEQYLVFGTYLDSHLKMMTACLWDAKLETMEGKIAGSLEKDDYENYLVTLKDGKLVSNPIKNLGEYLALFIAQGDRDLLGSKAQNKGIKNKELFGFDFGHAYRGENPILKSLSDDFSFIQPEAKKDKYKNISVFYDTLMSERMLSLFYMYVLADDYIQNSIFTPEEKKKIENAIELYKKAYPGFKAKIENMVNLNLKESQIFNGFIKKFADISMEASDHESVKNQYYHFVEAITDAKNHAQLSVKTMLTLFKNKMQRSPGEVNFIHSMEKFVSSCSLVSTDKKVSLNYVRIVPASKVSCEFKKNQTHFSINFLTTLDKMESIIFRLKSVFKKKRIPCKIQATGHTMCALSVEFEIQYLPKLKAIFSEKHLKKALMKKSLKNQSSTSAIMNEITTPEERLIQPSEIQVPVTEPLLPERRQSLRQPCPLPASDTVGMKLDK